MSFLFHSPAAGTGSVTSFALKTLRVGLVAIIGAWFLLLAAWLALHWLILPNIEQWRVPIEERASAALGITVKIGRIDVRSSGWVPAFELHDVVLLDAQQREALRLPRVAAALSARSLLQMQPRFAQLLVDAPTLEVRRDAQGRVSVAGLDTSAGAGDTAAADWILGQSEFVFRGGTLRWIDESRAAEPLVLSDVQLVLRNGLRSHQIRLDVSPPAALGERLTVRGKFTGSLLVPGADWQRWSGTLFAELPGADVSSLAPYVSLPLQMERGRGALRGWIDFDEGRPMAATVDAALRDVSMRLPAAAETLSLPSLSGRFQAQRRADLVSVAAEALAFTTDDGRGWPAGALRLSLRQDDDGRSTGLSGTPVTGGDFSADRVDLALLGYLGARLPIDPALRAKVSEWSPQGVIDGLALRWDGSVQAPSRYQLDATATGLSWAAGVTPSPAPRSTGRPGLRNAGLTVSATERGGTADVRVTDGAIEFPGVFEDPIVALKSFDARVAWRVQSNGAGRPPAVEVDLRDARFSNADATGRFDASWRTGEGSGSGRGGYMPGVLDLQGNLDRGDALKVGRYLPRGLPESARRYVDQAVRGGTLADVAFRVRGDLADFPASNAQQGEFRIGGRVRDATLDVMPGGGWPLFTQLTGELVFDRSSMTFRNANARVGALVVEGTSGAIANLADRSVLVLDGKGRGTLADALAFVNGSPVGGWIGHALAQASGSGNADLKLALSIPFDARPNTVKGSVTLAGNDVRLRPDLPMFRGARGRVDFTESSFGIVGGGARVLGGDLAFEGGSAPDGALRFSGQGVATAEGLRAAGELAAIAPLAASLSGQAAYRIGLDIVRGEPELSLTSTLQGMASELPAPLAKSAETALPLRIQSKLEPPAAGGAPQRDSLALDLGGVVQARFVRELGAAGSRVLRGGIGIGAAPPEPAVGVRANVQLGALDIDAWQRVLARAGPASPAASDAGYQPTEVGLRVDELRAAGRRLSAVVAGLSRAGEVWRASVDADQLAGYAEWRPDGQAPGLVYARLKRLTLPRAEAESVETMLEAPDANRPALDIVIEDFTLRDKPLGHVEIQAEHRAAADGVGHDWRLSKLTMQVPEARFEASGQWLKPAASGQRRRSLLDFRFDIADGGALLARLGTQGALRGGKGWLGGQVGWTGSPLSPDVASLGGSIEVAIESGQFLKAEPGAARLLGVLSLQALPRRLMLDFRDVFQEGFAFDSAVGNVQVRQGVATTNNLRIRGVQAAVLMEGQADLVRETQDLRVIVVPEINAGTASLAYAVINPAIGLGTFLAQLLLRKPILAASTREFHVSGSWDDPKVDVVQRSLNDPVPDVEGAAGAASTPAPASAPVQEVDNGSNR